MTSSSIESLPNQASVAWWCGQSSHRTRSGGPIRAQWRSYSRVGLASSISCNSAGSDSMKTYRDKCAKWRDISVIIIIINCALSLFFLIIYLCAYFKNFQSNSIVVEIKIIYIYHFYYINIFRVMRTAKLGIVHFRTFLVCKYLKFLGVQVCALFSNFG